MTSWRSSTSLRRAAALVTESQIQHGVFVADSTSPPPSPTPPHDPFDALLPRRLDAKDRGFLVELPNGTVVGTPPRAPPREPTAEEDLVGRLERDKAMRFLTALANAFGLEIEKVMVVVDESFFPGHMSEEDDDDADKPRRKIMKIAPAIMQTLNTAVFDLTSAFQDGDLYPFPSSDTSDDILSYVINTDNGAFMRAFLQLASAEVRYKGYFQPKYEQYAQNPKLITQQKLNIFETLAQHHWDPDTQNFYPSAQTSGAGATTVYL